MTRTGTPRPGPRRTNGSKLAAARIAAGLTQAQLAERIGLKTPSALHHWEQGHRKPKMESLQRIAAALNVPWQTLIDEESRP